MPFTKLSQFSFFTLSLSAFLLSACNEADTPKNSTAVKATPAPSITTQAPSTKTTTVSELNKPPRIFLRCRSCHSYEIGKKNAVGPNLVNVFGNPAGADNDYKFSQAITDSDIVWDEETLDAFLSNPSKTIPGTKMAFVGLKKEEDRKVLIEWMESLNEKE